MGNPDIAADSIAVRLLPKLRRLFPNEKIEQKDPNEDWDVLGVFIIIDSAAGIKGVKVFNELGKFAPPPRVTVHDFDAYANLRLLEKLGKLKKIKIIGIQPDLSFGKALDGVAAALRELINSDQS
jgi:hypothetical protein